MRIVYLHQYFVTPEMGGGTRSFELARRLVRAGHEVHMVTTDNRPEPSWRRGWRVTQEAGIEVHWLPVPYDNRMSYARRMRAFLAFAVGSARRAASLRADVVFATSTPLTIALPAVWASWRSGAPMVFEVRDLWPDVPIALGVLSNPLAIAAARLLERFAYGNARRIVALSPGMAEGVCRAGYPRERIDVIPNGCDLELFRPDPGAAAAFRSEHAWLGGRPLVAYTGTLGLVNGVDYLVRVAARVASLDPEVRFLIVGEGRAWDAVRSDAEAAGILGRSFFMMASLPKPGVARVMAAADVATSVVVDVPALWHNSANKFFDGLSSGTAFAVNHEGWQADLLREWDAGLVLPATDADGAARMLVDALHAPGWTRRAGANGRRLAEERFARDALATQLERSLRDAEARYVGKKSFEAS